MLVTTKRGANVDGVTFNYNGYYGISEAIRLPDIVDDAATFAELWNEANTNFGEIVVEAYGLLNARLSLSEVEMLGGNWQFALWAKNVQDRDNANYAIGTTANTFLTPRMYGAELIFEFEIDP